MQPLGEVDGELMTQAIRMREYADIQYQFTQEQRELVGFDNVFLMLV